MAHFAKLDENNVVIKVVTIGNEHVSYNGDPAGEEYCSNMWGGNWKQTSYNTRKGIHYNSDGTESADQTKAFRYNFAGNQCTYNEELDAFITPKPYSSWTLVSKEWTSPVAKPTSYKDINNNWILEFWDEDNQQWKGNPLVNEGTETATIDTNTVYTWNPDTSSWA